MFTAVREGIKTMPRGFVLFCVRNQDVTVAREHWSGGILTNQLKLRWYWSACILTHHVKLRWYLRVVKPCKFWSNRLVPLAKIDLKVDTDIINRFLVIEWIHVRSITPGNREYECQIVWVFNCMNGLDCVNLMAASKFTKITRL